MLRILITNDDGIHSEGIQALWKELKQLGEITVVAPDSEKSAISQAITVHHPIRVDKYCLSDSGICAWRVGGTPTDCIKIALETLLECPPDIIISGINHGANLGTDVLYSGTVSAAIEGAIHGIPSIAVSLDAWQAADFKPAAVFTKSIVKTVMENLLPPNTLLNVNVPSLPFAEIAGILVTKLGVRQYKNVFERRQDPRGRTYYWMGGSVLETENDSDSDIVAIKNRYISITPIHFDLTNYSIIQNLRKWNWNV